MTERARAIGYWNWSGELGVEVLIIKHDNVDIAYVRWSNEDTVHTRPIHYIEGFGYYIKWAKTKLYFSDCIRL